MFIIVLVLILFVLFDLLLESLENLFSPNELIEMGIRLDGSLALESK